VDDIVTTHFDIPADLSALHILEIDCGPGGAFASALFGAYVEIVRNTPFLVQAFFVFFGLPTLGLRLTPNIAGLLVMSINVSAYSAEIIRGGIEAMPRGYWEAARSLGLSHARTFYSVILPPSVQAVYPSLVSQFILLMLGSSVLSSISTTELTSVANDLQNMNFRTTETYIAAAALYLCLSTLLTLLLRMAERFVFPFARIGR
jgi:polar amino acid transport system permease protein